MSRSPAKRQLRDLMLPGVRLILGAIFIYAGWVKAGAPQDFADGIAAYRILPAAWVNIFALSLPAFEMMLGAWLIAGWRRRSAAFCAAITLLVFVTAIVSARARGLQVDCACFGSASPPGAPASPALALARDLVLTAAASFLYVAETRAGAPY